MTTANAVTNGLGDSLYEGIDISNLKPDSCSDIDGRPWPRKMRRVAGSYLADIAYGSYGATSVDLMAGVLIRDYGPTKYCLVVSHEDDRRHPEIWIRKGDKVIRYRCICGAVSSQAAEEYYCDRAWRTLVKSLPALDERRAKIAHSAACTVFSK